MKDELSVRVTKSFGVQPVLREVALRIPGGSIWAILGENGAGKSTLLRILRGLIPADDGELVWGDTKVDLRRIDTAQASRLGVTMVHQEGSLVPSLSVVDNALLRGRDRWLPRVRGATARRIAEVAENLGLPVDPSATVGGLTAGARQRAELALALLEPVRLLLLDEPTSTLSPPEIDALFTGVQRLTEQGTTVVLVTHKLAEIRRWADGVTVLRGGVVTEQFGRDAEPAAMVRAMVGEEIAAVTPPAAPRDEVLLALDDVVTSAGAPALSLQLRAGEVVGVAGVEGNGQAGLVAAIVGTEPVVRGRIRLAGTSVTEDSVAARRARGVVHIPEDRHGRAVILEESVAHNLLLGRQNELAGRFTKTGKQAFAEPLLAQYDVRPPAPWRPIRTLSGGNQQKVVCARELTWPGARVVVAVNPTKGIDVRAAAAVHGRLLAAAADGGAVLLVSSELDELWTMCHRVLVLYRGAFVLPLTRDDLNQPQARARVGRAMAGLAEEQAT